MVMVMGMEMGSSHPNEDKLSLPRGSCPGEPTWELSWIRVWTEIQIPDS